MTGRLVVRDFVPADRDAVLALNTRAKDPDGDIPASLQLYPALRDVPRHFQAHGAFLVGVIDGEIVAMGSIEPRGERTFEVGYIRVAIPHQRRGYARAMLGTLEARARSLGGTAATLNVAANNHGARRLYESIGYECVRTETVSGRDGEERHAACYTKELRGHDS